MEEELLKMQAEMEAAERERLRLWNERMEAEEMEPLETAVLSAKELADLTKQMLKDFGYIV